MGRPIQAMEKELVDSFTNTEYIQRFDRVHELISSMYDDHQNDRPVDRDTLGLLFIQFYQLHYFMSVHGFI
jgi:hypothetical protein